MKLPRCNSFIGGFTAAVLLFAIAFVLTQFRMQGGFRADSPDGQLALHASGPLGGGEGSTYTFKLLDKGSDSVLRRVEITFASNENTRGLREGEGDARWDPQSKYVDIIMAGDSVTRLWVPGARDGNEGPKSDDP